MNSPRPFNVSPSNIINCEEFFDDFFNSFFVSKGFEFKYSPTDFCIDLYEGNSKYIIEADLPGIPEEAINVDYINNFVIISASREIIEGMTSIQREKQYGDFRRMFYIEKVIPEKIEHSYSQGVLTIILPKA